MISNVILGIDPSLNCTGWCIIKNEGGKLSLLSSGTIPMEKITKDPVEKIILISKEIEKIINQNQEIKSVAMEDTFSNVNASSSLKLGMVRGAIIAIAGQKSIPIHQYLPRIVKQAIVGKGNAEKQQVAFMVKNMLSIQNTTFKTFDITDAIAVALAHHLVENSPILQQILNSKK